MGLASSQARLLLLTARKSDLEFRAQQITNSEMILAMQTEEVAREYSLKLSNQTLKYIDSSSQSEMTFTAASLPTITEGSGTKMRLQVLQDGKWKNWSESKSVSYKDKDGNYFSEAEYVQMLADDPSIEGQYEKVEISNNYTSAEILEGVQAGTMRIVYFEGSEENPENAKEVDAINGTQFSVAYDTSDDAAADAEYRRKTASIQIKEKRLQMDLSQVETQQKACETEIDSVKKIMDKNIERTFKVFS